jgi:hypothetical protein
MTSSTFTGSVPDVYERHLGPLLFVPQARDLGVRLHLESGSRLLELACGTAFERESGGASATAPMRAHVVTCR